MVLKWASSHRNSIVFMSTLSRSTASGSPFFSSYDAPVFMLETGFGASNFRIFTKMWKKSYFDYFCQAKVRVTAFNRYGAGYNGFGHLSVADTTNRLCVFPSSK